MTARALAVAAVIALLVQPSSAAAEDKRPCVSTTEYHQTKDVMHYRGSADAPPPTRRQLERRWEVRGLGVIDPAVSDDKDTFWMYPVCGYSFEEAQVWAVTTGRSGPVGIISLWIEPDAMANGHEYRAAVAEELDR